MVRPTRILVAAALGAAVAASCSQRAEPDAAPPPEPAAVRGLGAVPADAQTLIGLRPADLARSPLGTRAVEAALASDPEARERAERLAGACGVDPAADLETVIVALGPTREDLLLVATGNLDEDRVRRCLGKLLGSPPEKRRVAGARAYRVGSGERQVWLSFGGPRTLLLASHERWLAAARDPLAPKAARAPELSALVERVDTKAAIWMVSRLPEGAGREMATVTGARSPATAVFGHVLLGDAVAARLSVQAADTDDARRMVAFAKAHIADLTALVHPLGLGQIVYKIRFDHDGELARASLDLDAADVSRLESRLLSAGGGRPDGGEEE